MLVLSKSFLRPKRLAYQVDFSSVSMIFLGTSYLFIVKIYSFLIVFSIVFVFRLFMYASCRQCCEMAVFVTEPLQSSHSPEIRVLLYEYRRDPFPLHPSILIMGRTDRITNLLGA